MMLIYNLISIQFKCHIFMSLTHYIHTLDYIFFIVTLIKIVLNKKAFKIKIILLNYTILMKIRTLYFEDYIRYKLCAKKSFKKGLKFKILWIYKLSLFVLCPSTLGQVIVT